ncbi:hypothetical protein BN1013_01867 [Candidatus Rubidus massiliensis]|nr:hypothetical protein BN1013_01867 [Candidatus Rubidus massiliensis]
MTASINALPNWTNNSFIKGICHIPILGHIVSSVAINQLKKIGEENSPSKSVNQANTNVKNKEQNPELKERIEQLKTIKDRATGILGSIALVALFGSPALIGFLCGSLITGIVISAIFLGATLLFTLAFSAAANG